MLPLQSNGLANRSLLGLGNVQDHIFQIIQITVLSTIITDLGMSVRRTETDDVILVKARSASGITC